MVDAATAAALFAAAAVNAALRPYHRPRDGCFFVVLPL
eukprot:gene5553-60944_t